MELKTKVIRISNIVGIAIVISVVVYLAFYIVSDTLKPPPPETIPKNLFVEKDSIDIANLKNIDNLHICRNSFHNIWNSLYEDMLNGFLGENQQDNEDQHQLLWKRLNFSYVEQFILLSTMYFNQSDWSDNDLIGQCIMEIKEIGFVEFNTPKWTSLENFENSIRWFNNTQDLISKINRVTYLRDYFINNNLISINRTINTLTSQNCIKNNNKLSELNNEYENLKDSSNRYLKSKIEQYDNDFGKEGCKKIYEVTAYYKYYEVEREVEQWNNVFYISTELNDLLRNHKARLDYCFK